MATTARRAARDKRLARSERAQEYLDRTIAQRISSAFGDDGQKFSAGGRQIDDVCRAACSHPRQDPTEPSRYRYEFSDGSALIIDSQCWDLPADDGRFDI